LVKWIPGFHNFKIKHYVTMWLTGLSVVTLTIVISVVVYSGKKAIEEESDLYASSISKSMTPSLIEPLIENDFSELQDIIESHVEVRDVIRITFSDAKGRVIAQAPYSDSPSLVGFKESDQGRKYILKQTELEHAGHQLGTLKVYYSLSSAEGKLGGMIKNIILVTFIISFISIFVLSRMTDYLTFRLHHLMDKMKDFSNGDRNARAWEGHINELDILGKNFNAMASELNAMEVRMLNQNKMAALGEMASGIAHEINNPLAIIAGKTALLMKIVEKTPQADQRLGKEIVDIQNTAFRISKIIKGLKTFSRADESMQLEWQSVKSILSETLDFISEKMRHSGVKLHNNISEDYEILCDKVQISQVFLNLLGNSLDAIEHSNEKWIDVSVKVETGALNLIFTDSGAGIPQDLQQKIMQPFFTTKDIGKGTGLGLSISTGIIEKHGGKFLYNSQSANTQFIIRLAKFRTVGALKISA
jgi:signal transduction histidine kinase